MRQILFFIATLSITTSAFGQNGVGINTTGAAADASAMLDVSSTTGGMLVPRMTTVQRNAITSPATSLLIYNTDAGSFEFYNGSSWAPLGTLNQGIYTGDGTIPAGTDAAVSDYVNFDAGTFYIDGTNNRIGINNNAPSTSLDILGDSKTSGDIYFGTSGAVLKGADQGGTLELGPSIGSGEVPFIDFHYGTGSAQDFNVRLINVADNRLDFNTNIGTPLTLNGASVGIGRTSPEAKLHIYDNATSSQIFLGENGAADKTGIIKYLQGNGSGTGYLTLGHWGDNIDGGTGLIIKKGGNIGIGTNNPSASLDLNGSLKITDGTQGAGKILTSDASGNASWQNAPSGADGNGLYSGSGTTPSNTAVAVSNYVNFDANTFYIDGTNNRVGIGLNNPSYPLDITGNARANGEMISTLNGAGQFRAIGGNYGFFLRNDGANTYFMLTNSGDQYGNWNGLRPMTFEDATGNVNMGNNSLYVQHGGNTGVGTTTPYDKLDVNGDIRLGKYADNGSRYIGYANGNTNVASTPIAGLEIESVAPGTYSQNLHFYTHHFGVSAAKRMTIQYDGNVGIGTTTPSFPLSFGATTGNKIALYDSGSGNGYGFGIQGGLLQIYANSAADRVGIGSGNSGSFTETLTIKGGNVGIGETNPTTAKLVLTGSTGQQGIDLSSSDQYANMRVIQNTYSPLDKDLYIGYGSGATSKLHLYSNNSEVVTIEGGNKLKVNGNTEIASGNTLRVYGPSNSAYAELKHSGASGGNMHLDPINGGNTYINWFGGSVLYVGNGTSGGFGPVVASAFTVSSSERFKEDIIDSEYGLAQVMELNAKEYKYISDESNRNEVGLIAEEVEKVLPEVVYKDKDGLINGIDYSKLSPVLIEAIKEQQALIELLTKRIEELEKK